MLLVPSVFRAKEAPSKPGLQSRWVRRRFPRFLLLLPGIAILSGGLLKVQSPAPVLTRVADIPVPGSSARFDYQSLDPATGRLYIAQMGAGRLLVFDTRRNEVVTSLAGFPGVTGVLVVGSLDRVYASVTGRHQLVVLDAATLRVRARIPGIRFPDGIAYAPEARRIFVSDEFGRRDIVLDTEGDSLLGSIPLGGEAGNTQYDPVSKRIWVAVQTRNQLVEIDPTSLRILNRYDLPGAEHPHGLAFDSPQRLAFVAGEDNARLVVVDLDKRRVIEQHGVGKDPDVLAFDPGLGRLYVASESGVVSVFQERDRRLELLGEYRAPGAHSVSVDPTSHRVYLPLTNVGGRPVLRILVPSQRTK